MEAFLPRGLLREPLSALARAQAIVLTRTDAAPPGAVEHLRERLAAAAPGVPLALSAHVPVGLRQVSDGVETALPIEDLKGQRVELFSGIGNPEGFGRTVEDLGGLVVAHHAFGDHHSFSETDLDVLGGELPALTTAKDAARLSLLPGVQLPPVLWILDVELSVGAGAERLRELLQGLPPSQASRVRNSIHEGLHG